MVATTVATTAATTVATTVLTTRITTTDLENTTARRRFEGTYQLKEMGQVTAFNLCSDNVSKE